MWEMLKVSEEIFVWQYTGLLQSFCPLKTHPFFTNDCKLASIQSTTVGWTKSCPTFFFFFLIIHFTRIYHITEENICYYFRYIVI